jgi:hypothetical protein
MLRMVMLKVCQCKKMIEFFLPGLSSPCSTSKAMAARVKERRPGGEVYKLSSLTCTFLLPFSRPHSLF